MFLFKNEYLDLEAKNVINISDDKVDLIRSRREIGYLTIRLYL